MFKVAVQLTFMLLLLSVFYDFLSCNRFHKTQTYRCLKQVGSSKYGKVIFKKLKSIRRKYLKSLMWPLCNSPTNQGETVNQVEPNMHLIAGPVNLKDSASSLVQHILMCLNKNFASLQYPISISFDDLMKAAKAGAAVVTQHVKQCAQKLWSA